ncbi:MAG TPA: heme-degrading domain-containing protein [Terracidiphilus sp.]|jgi:uncharacterized protein (UPF0303 family)
MGLDDNLANRDLERIALQERELRLPRLDARVAWELGSKIRNLALERGLTLVVDVRRFGQPLFYAALDGSTPDNPEWVRRKGNVVARFHRSSYGVGLTQKLKGTTLFERQGLPVTDYAADGGSFPLAVEGAGVVGSVTVSGLPQRDDHNLVVEALCAIVGKDFTALGLQPEPA